MTPSRAEPSRMEELIEAHSSEAIRLAYLLTGDQELSRDIAQDAFVRLFSRFRHKAAPDAFRTYLRSTIVNLTRDQWRRRRSARAYEAINRRKKPQIAELPPIEERDELWVALQHVPMRQRAALVLRYYEDLSEQQAADVLGCSVGAVKGLVTRGTQAMRKALEEK